MNRVVMLLPIILPALNPHTAFATNLWLEADHELTIPAIINKEPQISDGSLRPSAKTSKVQKVINDPTSFPAPQESNKPGHSQESTPTLQSTD